MTVKEIIVVFIIIALMVVLAIGSYFLYQSYGTNNSLPVGTVCTQDAKLCPDGSYVARTGPTCEFKQCPAPIIINGWKTFADATKGIQFQYPETLGTTYISTSDWPPKAQLVNQLFSCIESGSEITQAGQTTKIIVGNNVYCLTKQSEGAAGSIYTQYAYASARGAQTAVLTFALRFPQCPNYPEPQQTACNNERISLNIDQIVNTITNTLQFAQ